MKYKKETWMVWYRTKGGNLASMEVDGNMTKQKAIDLVMEKRHLASSYPDGSSCLEWGVSGPIVKRMCYV